LKMDGAFLHQMEIPVYSFGNIQNHEPARKRKLLLHKKEISHIQSEIERKGLTCIPLKVYLKNGLAKVQIGIAKGKKLYDKRENIKSKDASREVARAVRMKS
jgi:SsrA-binding protein